jgi:hypothetical protein
MNRRDFLQCAAVLVSGTAVGRRGFALSEKQQAYLAATPGYTALPLNYLTPEQRQIVAAMAEIVIPRTDTPGAIDAGVPAYLERMMADWLNEQEREVFALGLADMEERIPREFGRAFHELDTGEQLAIMEALEQAASDSPWYDSGNNVHSDYLSDAPFICQFKELTIWGFFTSEVGATQVLRHNPMPMYFNGDIPLAPDESTWSGLPI